MDSTTFWTVLRKYTFLTLGAVLFAIGLEIFLIPNKIIDGGVAGISILVSEMTGIKLGFLLFGLNLPFLFIGYKQIGRTFVISTLYAITVGSVSTSLMHHVDPLTREPLLAAIFGGMILGIGIGIVIRVGGSLDGTEIVAIMLNKKLPFSVGEIVMFFNIFILSSAGLVYQWDSAMYSIVAYVVAFKAIDMTMTGLEEMRSVTIISDKEQEIAKAIHNRLGRGVTFFPARGAYSKEEKMTVYCIITRLEESKMKTIIHEIDPNAFFVIEHVSEVYGEGFKKKDIH